MIWRQATAEEYAGANRPPLPPRTLMRFRGDFLRRLGRSFDPSDGAYLLGWQPVVPCACGLCASGRFVRLDGFDRLEYGPVPSRHVAVAALEDSADMPPGWENPERDNPAARAFVQQLDRDRRQNPHSSYHRTARRASPMAWAVCFARSDWGWRGWHPKIRCRGALARDAAGQPCDPSDQRAQAWCLTGWLARNRKPKEALGSADAVWHAFPESLRRRIEGHEWTEPPAKPTALDRLMHHPLSLWWELGTNGDRWAERVLRLREGPIA